MELQVEEYVRTKGGVIGKVEQIGVALYWLEDGSSFNIKENSNKHSFDIKDLIEADDFVNDYKVYKENGKLAIEMCEHMPPYKYIKDIDIYSIVTKEMYESIKYEV